MQLKNVCPLFGVFVMAAAVYFLAGMATGGGQAEAAGQEEVYAVAETVIDPVPESGEESEADDTAVSDVTAGEQEPAEADPEEPAEDDQQQVEAADASEEESAEPDSGEESTVTSDDPETGSEPAEAQIHAEEQGAAEVPADDGAAGDESGSEGQPETVPEETAAAVEAVEVQASEEAAAAIAPEGEAQPQAQENEQQAEPEPESPPIVPQYMGSPEGSYTITAVGADYFTDALFIGDSRTVGLSEYCAELDQNATFFAKVSLTVKKALDLQFVKTPAGRKSVDELLSDGRQYGKVYIMLGLNEIGGGTSESFRDDYRVMIQRIREKQPYALIYIQGILHVTGSKSARESRMNNANINARNAALAELADPGRGIFYIDINPATDDANGDLNSELSFDEVHLKAKSYDLWYGYLKEHAAVRN